MSKLFALSSAAVLSIIVAGSVVAPAYAWHPKGQIVKSVQNMTAGGNAKDANSAADALSAKPGDILQYTVEVRNIAPKADKQYNDLAFGKLTDTLPAGVELVSNPAQRTITADFPTILPGNAFTKQYQVKVTAAVDGKIVENKACYTADSVVKDNPQSGCDVANVKVTVPVVTPTPTPTPVTPTPTPEVPVEPGKGAETPAVVEQPETLPSVGIGGNVAIFGAASSVFGYLGRALYLKRREA